MFSGGSRPCDRRGGLGRAVSKKHFFRPLGLSLVLKVRGGRVPQASPLDPPLTFLTAPILIYFIDSCISALLTLKTILFVDS